MSQHLASLLAPCPIGPSVELECENTLNRGQRSIGVPHAALAGATALLLGITRDQMLLEGLCELKSCDHASCHVAVAQMGERARVGDQL